MEQTLKQRLVGAAVIIAVGVIVIPMILDGAGERQLRKMPDAPIAKIRSKPGLVTEEDIPSSKTSETGQIVLTLPNDRVTEKPVHKPKTPVVNDKKEPKPVTEPDPKPKATAKPSVSAKLQVPVKPKPEKPKPEKPKPEKPSPQAKAQPKPEADPKVKETSKAVVDKPVTKLKENTITSSSPSGIWVVQVGSFTDPKKAFKYRDSLRAKKYKAFVEKISGRSGQSLYRVRIGPMPKREQASNMAAQLKQQGIKGFVTRHP